MKKKIFVKHAKVCRFHAKIIKFGIILSHLILNLRRGKHILEGNYPTTTAL